MTYQWDWDNDTRAPLWAGITKLQTSSSHQHLAKRSKLLDPSQPSSGPDLTVKPINQSNFCRESNQNPTPKVIRNKLLLQSCSNTTLGKILQNPYSREIPAKPWRTICGLDPCPTSTILRETRNSNTIIIIIGEMNVENPILITERFGRPRLTSTQTNAGITFWLYQWYVQWYLTTPNF